MPPKDDLCHRAENTAPGLLQSTAGHSGARCTSVGPQIGRVGAEGAVPGTRTGTIRERATDRAGRVSVAGGRERNRGEPQCLDGPAHRRHIGGAFRADANPKRASRSHRSPSAPRRHRDRRPPPAVRAGAEAASRASTSSSSSSLQPRSSIAAGLLAKTVNTARSIDGKAKSISSTGGTINESTDAIAQLVQTNKIARSILKTASPLDGVLTKIVKHRAPSINSDATLDRRPRELDHRRRPARSTRPRRRSAAPRRRSTASPTEINTTAGLDRRRRRRHQQRRRADQPHGARRSTRPSARAPGSSASLASSTTTRTRSSAA